MNRARKTLVALGLAAAVVTTGTGCSKRQIDSEETGSVSVPGTSWQLFCDGPNAFIWIQSWTDTEPDELEAIIYDHWACVDKNMSNDQTAPEEGPVPDIDSDGTIDDEEN